MPHKKNPDVAELLRGRANRLKALPNEFALLLGNLPSGYHRDLQLTKEIMIPAFEEIQSCLDVSHFMLENIRIKENILFDEKYAYLFSVERVNELVLQGVPFRDAYMQVGKEIASGTYQPSAHLHHTHEGSIGNLCNELIREQMKQVMEAFAFDEPLKAIENLLQ
jgi:argininosuccinate lyase